MLINIIELTLSYITLGILVMPLLIYINDKRNGWAFSFFVEDDEVIKLILLFPLLLAFEALVFITNFYLRIIETIFRPKGE